MANYGIKVSKPGENVLTCSSDKLIVNSEQECLKVYTFGTASITINVPALAVGETFEDEKYVDIEHNLGYVPFVKVFAREDKYTRWWKIPSRDIANWLAYWGGSFDQASIGITKQKLRLHLWVKRNANEDTGDLPAETVKYHFKYYIFINKMDDI